MIWALLGVSVVALVCVTLVSLIAFRQLEATRAEASGVEYEIRTLLMARVNTLENRLQFSSPDEFSHSQRVPDELSRAQAFSTNGWGEQRPEEAYGETEEEMREAALASQGIDLEGPTIG